MRAFGTDSQTYRPRRNVLRVARRKSVAGQMVGRPIHCDSARPIGRDRGPRTHVTPSMTLADRPVDVVLNDVGDESAMRYPSE